MFSDHEKRPEIVGDLLGYEKDEELSSIVYCGFNLNIQL